MDKISTLLVNLFQNIEKSNNSSLPSLALAFAICLACGLFIYYIYLRTYSGVYYSREFNRSLVLLTLVAAFLIRFIAVNPVLALGMVGAVSVVRFRTAVKDTMDTVFMFWAVAEGIVIGSGRNDYIALGIVSTATVGVVIFIISLVQGEKSTPFLLIVRHELSSAREVTFALNRLPRNARIKSRTVTQSGVEVIVEMRLPGYNNTLINSFLMINGVSDAQLVELHTEYGGE